MTVNPPKGNTEEGKELRVSEQKEPNDKGDSGNKDFSDLEQNQGILSGCEESGAIQESKFISKKLQL